MFRLSILIGKLTMMTLRIFNRGGSAFPGLVVESLNKNFLASLRSKISGDVILVTGSNGKTTTTKALYSVYEAVHGHVLTNKTGSNFRRGIISAAVEEATWFGSLQINAAIFEVDEGHSPLLARELKPDVLVVLNVFRDQLDRYGELDSTASKIKKAVEHAKHLVVYSDDPALAEIMHSKHKMHVTTFGSNIEIQKQLPHDAMLHNQAIEPVDHHPQVKLTDVQADGTVQKLKISIADNRYELETKLEGVHNAINLSAVLATCFARNLDLVRTKKVIKSLNPAFGRGEYIEWNDHTVLLQLVKNPAGFNQIIQTLRNVEMDAIVFLINDQIADGRDVSWLWDADIAAITQWKSFPERVYTGGSRTHDMSVRLKYENIMSKPFTSLKVLLEELASAESHQKIVIIATYTAMLESRALLVGESDAKEFWK